MILTEVHNVISTNGTVVHHNVPSPQSHCIPLQENQFSQSDLNTIASNVSIFCPFFFFFIGISLEVSV